MIALSTEAILIGALFCLYLYDSVQLLYCNEAVVIPRGKRDWIVDFGSERFSGIGKELYIPNLFQIHRPLFRLCWKFESSDEVSEPWEPPRGIFSPLAPLVWNMAIALFILLPLGLLTRLGGAMLLPALVLLFSSILLALAWVWFHREIFQLSTKRFAELAFESLICPPFALNMVRHVSAAIPVREDLVSAARRLQSASDWAKTRRKLVMRLADRIECEDADSERYKRLLEHRLKLVNEDESCQP